MGFAGRHNSSRSNNVGPSRFASLIPLRRDGRATSEPQSPGAAKPLQRDMAEVCSIQAGSTGSDGVGSCLTNFSLDRVVGLVSLFFMQAKVKTGWLSIRVLI